MTRVVTIEMGDEAVAYPYEVLEEVHVANDSIADTPIVVMWAPGTASALDSGSIGLGRDVGTTATFSRELDGEVLEFRFEDGNVVDTQSGSEWNLLGEAVTGPLVGSKLEPVVSINHFWFSWAAFRPETRIYQP